MTRWKAGLCVLGLWVGMGCGADDLPESTADDSVGTADDSLDTADEAVESTEAALSEGSLFFAARPDLRRCASPLCGGSFVRALNRQKTTCVDGTMAPECYVANLDLRPTGLPAATQQQLVSDQRKVIFVGAIRRSAKFRGFGTLVTKEAWLGVNDTPAGVTLLTKNNGIVCIKAPCPSFSGELVNRNREFMLSLDLSVLRASAPDLERVQEALQKDGALLSGRFRAPYSQTAQLSATQAFLRLSKPSKRLCGSRGLPACAAGEFCQFEEGTCGELDRPGVCTRRPQVCIEIFAPVCGCDGKTYGNACFAAAAGASVAHKGACEDEEPVICGGIFPRPCPGAGTCVFEKCPAGAKSCPVCADCTGVCECSGAAVLCRAGTVFDDSPSVCACVPLTRAK